MSTTYTIQPSKVKSKKYAFIIKNPNGRTKTINFGADGMSDYTIHKDPKRKELYIKRHQKNENWSHSLTNLSPGYLSRWLLWHLPSFKDAVKDMEKRLNIHIQMH